MLAHSPVVTMANDSGPSSQSTTSPSTRGGPAPVDNGFFSPRSFSQLGYFFAGAGFVFFSTMITRRAIVRKQLAAFPKFYSPSHAPAGKQGNPEGSMIALEALNLATINVISFGIMATGGLAWAFDISSVDELKEKARASIRGQAGALDADAEREFEEWAAKVLTKFGKTASEEESDAQSKPDKKD